MLIESIKTFLEDTGVAQFFVSGGWKGLVMIAVACVLCYLAIKKQFEPLLLLPIAIGMLLTNLLGSGVYNELFFAGGHIHWDLFGGAEITEELIVEFVNGLNLELNGETFVANSLPEIRAVLDQLSEVSNHPEAIINLYDSGVTSITPGLIDVLYLGVKLGIYPCLIFVGVGAMTDFGPLIANPKSLILGAAAQIGIFATYAAATGILGFTGAEAASIGIIGGADGPTAIFVTTKLAPHLLGPIAVAAYSYMALVPVIQPPIMKLLTTKEERSIVMKPLRQVTKVQKILFPIVVTILVHLIVPSATPLVGCLMFGNLLRECGVCERLSKTVQNELMNIVTVFLGISVGATATAATFLSLNTIKIIVLGVVAFGVATAGGVLIAKLMNVFLPEGKKINPLIGSAGVSAVPMAARVSQKVGQKENPGNFLLMHAMGPNVAGVIGSAIAAGVLIAFFG
ncbi:MAG: sodium ion-translocating decarboxylase subunit beta [Clostridia bacterium]|nr:sodium ion-translocating decarboxylase subunit beta [Clostridia bacterium]